MSNSSSQHREELNVVKPLDFRTTVSVPNIVDSIAIDMSASEFKVWMLLYAMTGHVVPRKLSNSQMAHMIGVGTSTIASAKLSLKGRNLIKTSNSAKTAVTIVTLDELWRRNAELNGIDPESDIIKHFFRIPRSVLLNPELTATDFRVWCHIKRVCGEGGVCFKAASTAAADSGTGLRQYRASVKSLVAAGYIEGEIGNITVPTIRTSTYDCIMIDATSKYVRSLSEKGTSLSEKGTHKNIDHNNKEFNKESLSKNESVVGSKEPAQAQACDGVGEQRELKEKEELDTYGATIPADDDSEAAALSRWNRILDICGYFLVQRNGEGGDGVMSLDWAKANADRMIKPAKNILAYRNYDLSAAKAALDAVRAKHIKRAFNPTTLDYVWPDVKAHFDAAGTPVDESNKIIGVISVEEIARRREVEKRVMSDVKALSRKRRAAAARACDILGVGHDEKEAFLGRYGVPMLDRIGDDLFTMDAATFVGMLSSDEISEIADRGVDIRLHA